MTRISALFDRCSREDRAALVTFVMAGDPDPLVSRKILLSLPAAGADIIELGMPFSDPIGDGEQVQDAAQRALKGGMTLRKTLELVRAFRSGNDTTPIAAMGYYNPIYVYGVERFVEEAKEAGIDALMVVDLPPELDDELCLPALGAGLDWIRFVTPTTDEKRLPKVLTNSSGFLYYVSANGVSGTMAPDFSKVEEAVAGIRESTPLPVAVGFGIKTAATAREVARFADAVVVGSAIAGIVKTSLDSEGRATPWTVSDVENCVSELAHAVRSTRRLCPRNPSTPSSVIGRSLALTPA